METPASRVPLVDSTRVRMGINLDIIFAGVADGVAALDNDLRYVFINDAAERLVGINRESALGRTPMELFPSETIAGHLDVFSDGRAKELLITPNGIRIVWLLAEADRARYGVFRQAEFGSVEIDPAQVEDLLQRLLRLRDAIMARGGGAP